MQDLIFTSMIRFFSAEFEEYAYSECSSLSLAEFIVEWELRLDAATAAGCHYSEVSLNMEFFA
jgi:hypothetical protein